MTLSTLKTKSFCYIAYIILSRMFYSELLCSALWRNKWQFRCNWRCKVNNIYVCYVVGNVARYFNGRIKNWVKHCDQENHFKDMAIPMKQGIGHGYSCFMNLLIMFCTQPWWKSTWAKSSLTKKKWALIHSVSKSTNL